MPEKRHGKYLLSEPLVTLAELDWYLGQKGMFEWKGKLLHHTFIRNLSLAMIYGAFRYKTLRYAQPEKEMNNP